MKVWYPPPYEREIWHYQHGNIDQIKRAIEQFPWEKSSRNLRINEMVYLFHKTIKNIQSNYIPHETTTCDDREPPWIKNKIKQLIQEINNKYRSYILSKKNPQIFEKVKYLQNQLKFLTESIKERYCLRISKKLKDPMTSAKTYCSILKSLLNNKKIHCIPPLFHQNKYVTDFKKKAELFNCFFAKQCSIINDFSELPSNIYKKTYKSISTVTVTSVDIATIIQKLDPNKANDHDMLSIRMFKLYGKSISKLLELIFQSCITHNEFATGWKKANVVPVHKQVTNRF